MKLSYIAGVFTAVLLLFFACFGLSVSKADKTGHDMVFYNQQLKLLEDDLQNGMDREALEEKYQCILLFSADMDYKSRLYDNMDEGNVILDHYEGDVIRGKVIWQAKSSSYKRLNQKLLKQAAILCAGMLLAGYGMLAAVYACFLRPFKRLQQFSNEVAKGNLDLPLPMRRHNFFGAFTESFDLMREELKRARESEYLANISKKELVAELSHDIKTPLATIKAACEVLEIKEKNADTLEKVGVIANKAHFIDNLVNNMFHATMEELMVLKVETVEESSLCILRMLKEFKIYGEITFENEMPPCLICMDPVRLQQVFDNIMNNSYKYASGAINVSFLETAEGIQIKIRDHGPGVPEEELALVTQKFYRGRNAKGKSGAGLGLYLTQSFMEQMRGGMECYNQEGFVISLFLRKVSL